MRSIIADSTIEKYLENLYINEKFTFGIIIGQKTSQNKEYVIHFAKTTFEDIYENGNNKDDAVDKTNQIDSLETVNNTLIVEHALNATRMIAGSFSIMGFFCCSSKDIFEDVNEFKNLKQLINSYSELYYSTTTTSNLVDDQQMEQLIFYYAGSKKFCCKSINVNETGKGKPVDWRFQEPLQWQLIEVFYDICEVFPLTVSSKKRQIDENIELSLSEITKKVNNSLILFDGELISDTDTYDSMFKKKHKQKKEGNFVQASIYFSSDDEVIENCIKIETFNGSVNYKGVISSRIWVHPKNTFSEICNFIKVDIIRSVSSRIRLHIDASYIEDGNGDTNDEDDDSELVNATIDTTFTSNGGGSGGGGGGGVFGCGGPPKRIYFQINKTNSIQFSDYIFRGEDEDTVIMQAKDILDASIDKDNIFMNVELFSEVSEPIESLTNNPDRTSVSGDPKRNLYVFGIVFSLAILILSIGWHFMFNY